MDGKKKKGEFSHPGEILRPIEFFHHRRRCRRCACNAKVQFLTKGEREREKKIKRDLATISDPVAYANTLAILIIGISSEKPRVRHAFVRGRESR